MVDRMQLRQYLDPRLAWKGSSEVDKVRLYARQSFVGICVLIAIAAVTDSIGTNAWIVAAALTVCCANNRAEAIWRKFQEITVVAVRETCGLK